MNRREAAKHLLEEQCVERGLNVDNAVTVLIWQANKAKATELTADDYENVVLARADDFFSEVAERYPA